MRRKRTNSRLYYQFLLSHVLIFAIPFIILSSVVYYNAVVKFKGEIEASNLYKLNQVKNTIDVLAKGLDNTASRISIDAKLTPFMVKSGNYNEIEAVDELGKYKANSTIVDETALYFHGDDRLYTSSGINAFDTFTKRVYGFNGLEGTELNKEMSELKSPQIRRVQAQVPGTDQRQNVLMYMFPIPRNSQSPYATVSFFVRESVLTDLVGPILGDFGGSIYILDSGGSMLASRSRETTLTEPDARQIVRQNDESEIQDVRFGGGHYSMMQAKSGLTGWSYVIIMPTKQFLGRVLEMRSFMLFVCGAVVAFGIWAAVLLSMRQYRPIRNLANQARSISGKAPGQSRSHELDLIRDTVLAASDLSKKIDEQRPAVREQFLARLLMGSLRDEQEVDDFVMREQVVLRGSGCFAAVIQMSADVPVSPRQREDLLRMLAEVTTTHAMGYGVELISGPAVALVFSADGGDADFRAIQTEAAAHVSRIFELCCGTRPTIGVGSQAAGLHQINRSYIEASAAIDQSIRVRSGETLFFTDMSEQQDGSGWFSREEQIRLVQSLKQGNAEAAKSALSQIVRDLEGKEVSMFFFRCMSFDLINTFLRTMNDLKLAIPQAYRQRLTDFTTLRQLEGGMNGLIDMICRYVHDNKESKNSALGKETIRYIEEHYKEYDLSLEKLADHFQMSVSYFSRYMKDQTGYTFTEYITHLRMEEVKRLLRHSSLPIKDIVNRVGYADVSNFMRKFKNIEGITLGQYRKLYS
ncbi:helix-turn-helix domain-containing protein [Paenibacillus sp. XY044]|uniref:helix-turn-helix domain-containing protein n=1 Tax=Paenibacillus sp. XY044 TaxID=2026089 RepID=UPI000B9953D9|nr:helix-turn-helix domain-containing protein [Paenibacillus sp. XY044]OZB95270.1 hypothetical protein CJP46_16450 [Paenibacillus sp. XY044]